MRPSSNVRPKLDTTTALSPASQACSRTASPVTACIAKNCQTAHSKFADGPRRSRRRNQGVIMRRTATAVGVTIVVLTMSAGADEKPPAGYQQAMRDNGQAMQIVRQAAKEIEDSGAGAQDYMPFEQAT